MGKIGNSASFEKNKRNKEHKRRNGISEINKTTKVSNRNHFKFLSIIQEQREEREKDSVADDHLLFNEEDEHQYKDKDKESGRNIDRQFENKEDKDHKVSIGQLSSTIKNTRCNFNDIRNSIENEFISSEERLNASSNNKETNSTNSFLYKANTVLLSFNKRKLQEEENKWNNLENQTPFFRKCIKPNNKRSLTVVQQVFDSLSEEENDELKNTDFRKWSIHPESNFMLIFNFFLIFSLFMTAYIIPYFSCFNLTGKQIGRAHV